MRSVLSRYPSSAFQAAILEENGFQVVVCDIDDGGYDAKLIPSGAERRVLERLSDLFAGNRASSLKKILGRQRFHSRLKAVLDELRPHLVISYDPPAFATMTRIIKSGRVPKFMHIWHCHELAEISDDMGWGTRRDLLRTKAAADLGVDRRVRFLGAVPHDAVLSWMKQAGVFVLVSSSEGMPFTLLEAMAAACAIVCSSIPRNRALLDDAQAMFVDVGDDSRLGARLQQLLADPVLAEQYGGKAHERAKKFDWPTIIGREVALYERLVEEGRIAR